MWWASDGRGVIVLVSHDAYFQAQGQTTTSHLLFYQLRSSIDPVYAFTTNNEFGAGEGDTLMGWTLKPLGVAFAMGKATYVLAQTHFLLICMRHPPSILKVPLSRPTSAPCTRWISFSATTAGWRRGGAG